MPFDPTKPANGSPLSSEEMRGQLTALKALIDAVPAGPPGPQGPAFSSVQIGSVTTGAPGSPASASVATFGNNVEISFVIPEGQPGEVTTVELSNEIAGTARNPNTVAPLGLAVSDPPTQSEMQQIVAKLDELIAALTR